MASNSDRDLAKEQFDRGDYDAAIASYDRALVIQPEDAELLFFRGAATMFKGAYGAAIEDFSRVIGNKPDCSNAFYNRAYCLRRIGKNEEALNDFNAYLQRHPNDSEALLERGKCHLDLEHSTWALTWALSDFDRALQLNPDHVETIFYRGRAYLSREQWQKAIEDYDRTLQLSPAYYGSYYNRALAKTKLEDFRGAIVDFTSYLEHLPKNAQTYVNRANCHLALCYYERAADDFETALELDAQREKDLRPELLKVKKLHEKQEKKVHSTSSPLFKFFRLKMPPSYGIFLVFYTVAVPLTIGVILWYSNPKTPRVTDPFLNFTFFGYYLGVLAFCGITISLSNMFLWGNGRRWVREAVYSHLRLSGGREGGQAAQEQILALVPCKARQLQGRLASLKRVPLVCLCFLDQRLLVISATTGEVLELVHADLQKIYLVEKQSRRRFRLAIQTGGGISTFELSRLEDMVRIINVLKQQGIVLGYLPSEDQSRGFQIGLAGVFLAFIAAAAFCFNQTGIFGGLFSKTPKETELLKFGVFGAPRSVAFSPDCRFLAVADSGGDISLWGLQDRQELGTFKGHKDDAVNSLMFNSDGKRLVSGSFSTIKVWDAFSGQEILNPVSRGESVYCVALNLEGSRLAWGGIEKEVKVWDAVSGRKVFSLPGHVEGVSCVAFSPDGKRLVSSSLKEVKVWDAENGRELSTLGQEHIVTSLVFSPDGTRLAVGTHGHIKIWDLNTGQENHKLELNNLKVGEFKSVIFSPDGTRLAASAGNFIAVWNVKPTKFWEASTGRHIHNLEAPIARELIGLAFSPDGKRLYSVSRSRWGGEVMIWE